MGFGRRKRRAITAALGVALVGALAFGVVQAFARDASVISRIRKNRDACAAPSKHRAIGKATFTRTGDTVKVKVVITNGEPGRYTAILYDNDCNALSPQADFKVHADGDGSATLTVPGVPGHRFFVDAVDITAAYSNESDYVKP